MTWQKDKYERNLMSKHFPWLFSLKLTILKPKIENEGIWNSNGDITTRKSVACSYCYIFLGISLKKWHIILRNNSEIAGTLNRRADNFIGVHYYSTKKALNILASCCCCCRDRDRCKNDEGERGRNGRWKNDRPPGTIVGGCSCTQLGMAWLIKGGSRDETRNRWTHCDGHWREIARLLAAAIKKGDAGWLATEA